MNDKSQEISKFLKIIIFLDGLGCFIVGLGFLFFTEALMSFIEWPFSDYIFGQIIGLTFLTYGIMNFLASRKSKWDEIEIALISDTIFDFLGAIFMMWNAIQYNLSIYIYAISGLLMGFGIIYTFYFIKRL
jgi:hypothetical protein